MDWDAQRYEKWYASDQGRAALAAERRLLDSVVDQWPRRNQRVLEIGCGTGIFQQILFDDGFDVAGIDRSPAMIEGARARLGPGAELYIGNGEALRFAYTAPDTLHAIQWRDGQGHMEFADDLNHPISGSELYAEEVAPYVALWTAEKNRLAALAAEAAARSEAEYNSPEAAQARFTAAIQSHLDAWAQTRNYDGIMSACTYATSTVEKFRAEGGEIYVKAGAAE